VLLLNSPHNPTGGVLDEPDCARIADLAIEHGLFLVSDEVYGDLVYDRRRAPSVLSQPGMAAHVICVDSVSKGYAMCGWRVGFAVAPPVLARRLQALMLPVGLCAPSIGQVAALEALTSPASAAAAARMRDEFRRRRDTMLAGLLRIPGFRCARPAGAFYLLPNIEETGLSDVELAKRLLLEGGVTTLPGSAFGAQGNGRLRLSYAASLEDIEEGLRRIGRVLEDHV